MSSNLLRDFQRVTKARPCLVCGKPDWCLVARGEGDAPSRAICKRIESPNVWGEAGWMHRLDTTYTRHAPRVRTNTVALGWASTWSISDLLRRCARGDAPGQRANLAHQLEVSESSLVRLSAGWISKAELEAMDQAARTGAWTFPMRDEHGEPIGVRLRTPGGRKLAVSGSRNGLFVPTDHGRPSLLVIAEGESDTAALLDLGFATIGRPGARGADEIVGRFVRLTRPTEVVVMADNDSVGIDGAMRLGRELRMECGRVRVVSPPPGIKDARAWKQAGATHAAVLDVICAAPLIGVTVTTKGAC